jgi:hypothetical protein
LPDQFWHLTPIETDNFIQGRLEGDFETAWRHAAVSRMKRLPNDPAELYQRRDQIQSPNEMFRKLEAFRQAKNAHNQTKSQRKKKPDGK